jgi:hypothetical protein
MMRTKFAGVTLPLCASHADGTALIAAAPVRDAIACAESSAVMAARITES